MITKKILGTLLGLLCVYGNSWSMPLSEGQEHETVHYEVLKSSFPSPDAASGVNCWWWWLNGNVTKQAITKDLEAMKSKHFCGAMIFDAGGHNQRGNKDIPDGPLFGSKAWKELFIFALDEAKRLDLEIGFNIQSGWNLGGPYVTPQYAAKQFTYTEMQVTGGKTIVSQLPQPETYKGFYKDIVVLAFPAGEAFRTNETIEALDLKLGFHELGGSAPDCRFLLTNTPQKGSAKSNRPTYRVNRKDVVDLTDRMDKGGRLTWKAPAGEWNIMRIGYTCTHAEVSTSSNQWQGNVIDYMSREAFDFYWDGVVEPILQAAGPHVGTTLKFMETDSWECGGMNWTDNFAQEFRTYRGYDLLPYLPIVAGHVIDDIDTSNAFLADFRKTLAD